MRTSDSAATTRVQSTKDAGPWTLERCFTVSTVVVVMVLVGLTIVLVHVQLRNSLKSGLEERGLSMARSIGAVVSPSLLAYNYAALQIAAEAAARDSILEYVVIHDKEGAIAGSAGLLTAPRARKETLSPAASAPAVLDARARIRPDDEETLLEVVVPVVVEGSKDPWGTVRLGMSVEPMVEQLKRIDIALAAIGVCLALLMAAASRWFARKITAPLRRLAAGTIALRSGDLSHRVPVTSLKELADLTHAFNTMIAQLEEKEHESDRFQRRLERLNATLEQHILDRTRALQESEAHYRLLVEHSPDAIIIVQEGKLQFVNSVFETIFGVDREQVFSHDFDLLTIFDASSTRDVAERIEGWERGETPGPIIVQAHDTAGKILQIELRGIAIEYRGRLAAECLLIDTTETSELRERLHETHKLRSLGELASGVAHDFNNLLGAILGRAQLLRRRDLPPDMDAELAVIEKAARDGRETVRRIQEFSRVRKERHFDTIQLGEILRDSLEMTRTQWKTEAESRGISIQTHLETPEVSPVLGNATELRELFMNLILNAVDAMPQGGTLSITSDEISGKVRVTVVDTGIGMSESTRQRVFDPFFTTKGSRGTGLGMSMAYGILMRHGGTVDVRSELGRGTSFVIEFPVAENNTGTVEIPLSERSAPQRSSHILVIDDDPEIAGVLSEVLKLQGHSVETSMSAREGVRRATTEAFDLIFTDLGMPEMSGWEVVRAIRAAKPQAAVALVTGWAASIEASDLQAHGISALVHKPFEIEEVHRTTERLLRHATPV